MSLPSPEWITAISGVAALLIVAIGAFAALRQIAHMRQGIHVEVVLRLFEQWQSQHIRDSYLFVRNDLPRVVADPAVQATLRSGTVPAEVDPALAVANFFEAIGQLVAREVLDPALVIDAFPIAVVWEHCAPFIAPLREAHPEALEMFEYAAATARERDARRGSASLYPNGAPRMPLPPAGSR